MSEVCHDHGSNGAQRYACCTRYGIAHNGFQEFALHPFPVRFQCQEKGGDANGHGRNQRQLNGLEGIVQREQQGNDAEGKGIQRLHQEQGSGTGNIVDDPPAFIHHQRQGRKVCIQQGKLCRMLRRICTTSHGNGAIRRFQGRNIVNAVASHGHAVTIALQSLDQLFFLHGRYTSEDCILFSSIPKLTFGGQGGSIYPSIPAFQLHTLGNGGHRARVIAADHLDGHTLLPEISQGVGRIFPQGIAQANQTQHLGHRRSIRVCDASFSPCQCQHPKAFSRIGVNGLAQVIREMIFQHKTGRTQNQSVSLREGYSRLLPLG